MRLLFRVTGAVLRVLVEGVLCLPARVVDAVHAARREHARYTAASVVLRPNWVEGVDKQRLLLTVLHAEEVQLVDWIYEWRAAYVYPAENGPVLVIHKVDGVYHYTALPEVAHGSWHTPLRRA